MVDRNGVVNVTESRPLLSVIVPVYAVEDFLPGCLESIQAGLSQADAEAVEIVAVDDASPDGCAELLDSYAARHRGVRVVHLAHNGGLGLARNAGLTQARGAYVWFVDSDDVLPAGSVSAVLRRLRENRPDVLLIDHLRWHEDGRLEVDASSPVLRGVDGLTSVAQRPALLRLQHTAWNKVVNRDFLDRIDIRFLPGWYEDIPFSHPVLLAAERIDVLDRVCYHYRVGRAGAITSTRSHRHFEAFDQYERLQSWVRSHPVSPHLQVELFTLMISHYLVIAGNDSRMLRWQRRAFFRRAATHYRRYRPADCQTPEGVAGLRHRLLRINSYALYAALRHAYRVAGRASVVAAAAGPAPAPASVVTVAPTPAPGAATPASTDPDMSPPVRRDLAYGPQSAQGSPIC